MFILCIFIILLIICIHILIPESTNRLHCHFSTTLYTITSLTNASYKFPGRHAVDLNLWDNNIQISAFNLCACFALLFSFYGSINCYQKSVWNDWGFECWNAADQKWLFCLLLSEMCSVSLLFNLSITARDMSFGHGRRAKNLVWLANSDAQCLCSHLIAWNYMQMYNFQKYSLWRTSWVFFLITVPRLLRAIHCINRKNEWLYPLGWIPKWNCSINGLIQYPLKSVRIFPLSSVGTGLITNCCIATPKGWVIPSADYPALNNRLCRISGGSRVCLQAGAWKATLFHV